jgi:TP901-1 family phage major tail protein
MTAQKGKDLLVKIADGAGFTTVAGLRMRRLAFNAETVDITHAESANRWRELLDGAGVKRASVWGRGLFKDAATDAVMRQTFFDGTIVNYQIVIRLRHGARAVPDHQSRIRRRTERQHQRAPDAADLGLDLTAMFVGHVWPFVPGAAQHGFVVRCRPGTPVTKKKAGPRIRGALLRMRYALHRVRGTSQRAEDLLALTERFASGRLKARDLTRIIAAGLRGAGEPVRDEDVAAMAVDGGAQGYVRIAAELIAVTFGETAA